MILITISFSFSVTQHRLWHSNRYLERGVRSLHQVVRQFLDLATFYLLTSPLKEIYVVWGVLLMITSGTVDTITGYNLSDYNTVKLLFVGLLTYNLFSVAYQLREVSRFSKYKINLWVIWSLIMLKTGERIISFLAAKRAYGLERVHLLSDYMQSEHEAASDVVVDPTYMKGYKYIIVHGEEKLNTVVSNEPSNPREVPRYELRFHRTDQVITVGGVWRCEGGLLSSKMDREDRFKDTCLSFALFKLLRIRFTDFPSAELYSEERKSTRELVIRGLLQPHDKRRIFRVVKTELGFLKDLFFTKYPIVFGCGFPIYNFILSFMLLAATGWLAMAANHRYRNRDPELDQRVGGPEIDLYITTVLVAMIIIMEIIELLTYLLSDWATVMLICWYVKVSWLRKWSCLDHAFKLLFRTRFSDPIRKDLGQYSLLRYYKSSFQTKLYKATFGFAGKKLGDGVKKGTSVKLSYEVKEAIFDSLKSSNGHLSNGESSLRRNQMSQLCWACRLPNYMHTTMVWHIATCFCEIKPTSQDIANKVATTLSKYLGVENESDVYEKMMEVDDLKVSIIRMGAILGKKLATIEDDIFDGKLWLTSGQSISCILLHPTMSMLIERTSRLVASSLHIYGLFYTMQAFLSGHLSQIHMVASLREIEM
ncbi:hypothetical protein Cni_G22228 [Canna indica]|uniref:DUF4220 domain-containing protein n=1 Tax=Canna indica TaxID=4628 RepID=A0AAQ3KR11_9LILI|nr:hypothetical protein Cni_G22228 [Canna indica]